MKRTVKEKNVKCLFTVVLMMALILLLNPKTIRAVEMDATQNPETPKTDFVCADSQTVDPSLLRNLSILGGEELLSDTVQPDLSFFQVDAISRGKVTPSVGDINTLVVMVDFADTKFKDSTTTEYIQNLMFGEPDENSDKYPLESVNAWYQRSSFGKLKFHGDVVEVHLANTREYYTVTVQNP